MSFGFTQLKGVNSVFEGSDKSARRARRKRTDHLRTLPDILPAIAIAVAADVRDARILPDVFHLFRGGSGFEGLSLLNGKVIDIIHMNDYPSSKPVNEQTDSDRVYPGDGVAPLKQVLRDLKSIGGSKVLSLELFNKSYWSQDPLVVARTGLQKMKSLVSEIES